jgi:hypothetical protein
MIAVVIPCLVVFFQNNSMINAGTIVLPSATSDSRDAVRNFDAPAFPIGGAKLDVGFVPKILLKICVKADDRGKAVEAIVKAARTGAVGDGKLFIYPVQDVVRIRTGETGEVAL